MERNLSFLVSGSYVCTQKKRPSKDLFCYTGIMKTNPRFYNLYYVMKSMAHNAMMAVIIIIIPIIMKSFLCGRNGVFWPESTATRPVVNNIPQGKNAKNGKIRISHAVTFVRAKQLLNPGPQFHQGMQPQGMHFRIPESQNRPVCLS